MASKEVWGRISNKRDTEENWLKNDPVLLDAEIVFVDEPDGGIRYKLGDGVSKFSALKYLDLDEDDALTLVTELELLQLVANEDGSLCTDENGKLISLQKESGDYEFVRLNDVPVATDLQTEPYALIVHDGKVMQSAELALKKDVAESLADLYSPSDELLSLITADMLPAIYTGNKILTDGAGRIVLRY